MARATFALAMYHKSHISVTRITHQRSYMIKNDTDVRPVIFTCTRDSGMPVAGGEAGEVQRDMPTIIELLHAQACLRCSICIEANLDMTNNEPPVLMSARASLTALITH
jgi:hypothetical protein